MANQKNSSVKVILGVVAGVLIFAGSFYVLKKSVIPDHTLYNKMTEATSVVNKTCPMMVDQETRLDNVVAYPDSTIHYNFTLVNYTLESIDTVQFRSLVEPEIIKAVKINPAMKLFRDNHVTMKYNYKDRAFANIISIVVTPDMYLDAASE